MLEPEALRRTEKRCHAEPKDRDPQKISKTSPAGSCCYIPGTKRFRCKLNPKTGTRQKKPRGKCALK